jgi:tryptophan-rich sensory protein
MNTYTWYKSLKKPSWAPPSWLFGPVWSVLYVIIAVTFGSVIFKAASGQIPPVVVLPFILNLIFNVIFTPIQFGLKNNQLAFADILLVDLTLIWSLTAVFPLMSWVSYANIPYLLWGSFATLLQLNVTLMNSKK